MKKYEKYEDIEQEYRFDLEDILGSNSYEELKKEYFNLFAQQIEIKDSKYESFEKYCKSIKLDEKMIILSNKISNYLSNKLNTNVVSHNVNKLISEFESEKANYSKLFGSEINRIAKNKEKIKNWIQKPDLKEIKKDMEAILEELDHKLDDNVELYLTSTAHGNPNVEEIFGILTDSEIEYGFAHDKWGKKYEITEGTRPQLMKNKDELVRKQTYFNYAGGFLKHKQSLAKLLYQHIKEISVNALHRKYSSSLDSILSGDKVDKTLLQIIYSSVQENLNIFQKYWKAHKKFFEIKFNKKFELWDGAVDLVKVKNKYTVKEGQNILKKITSVMPYEYPKIVEQAINERWIDYMNVPSKRSGAYSIGESYGLNKKYILMNWDNTINSVNTLCHEMGHSMHSYYSDKNQSVFRSQYTIFLAEIASIFNELLLNDYLISKAKSDEEKFFLINESIGDFIGTVLRQTQWSNYEYELYNRIDKDEPLNSYEEIEKLYVDIAKKYTISDVEPKIGDAINVYSVIVPHFYYYFYVYKYALGYIVANVFFQKYKQDGENALKNYVNKFLSAGDKDWPAAILKEAGVDIYDKSIYEKAFSILDYKVEEYIKLGNKIFKK
ncbi:oligoendopeptidase F [Metamycoplasma phocicerebrale]|uniref:Oligopeptidase F n=1 Tax=Metamycoplasma phocicerebrale TaxID=142649 RepID=A0A3Q9VA16_9BACT|nr:oligoendopeptidase F [Metamycoplasma phocicerebrale]AZZ65365.1 oligoendopeptidase F [Metamycoplasma phocicerebrale]